MTVKPCSSPRTRVAVIYGGTSNEHSISCVSAGAVMANLNDTLFDVVPVGITREGLWTVGTTDQKKLAIAGRTLPEVHMTRPVELTINPTEPGMIRFVDTGEFYAQVDVIFPVLHGRHGEDGTIQGLCAMAGVPFVGCGVLASAACMDKEYTKKLLGAAGVPVADMVVLFDKDETLTPAEKKRLGLPVYVKPASGGSSIGVSRVTDWDDLSAAVSAAFAEDTKVLVEPAITGAEVESGVLEFPDHHLEVSELALLNNTTSGHDGFYDFDTKYLDHVVEPKIPAPLPSETTAAVKELALQAFRAIGGEGLARIDFFVQEDGKALVNEINTLPGFTPISMYPAVFAARGIDYAELLSTLVNTALAAGAR